MCVHHMRVTTCMRQVVPVSASVSDAVHLVAARVVGLMSPAMAAGEAEERHRGHSGASQNHAEDVEVHLYVK
jgi:hypothetical protein